MAGSSKFGDSNFQTLFESGELRVYKNSSGEIFVEIPDERAGIRISSDGYKLLVTASAGLLTPWAVNGLPAFKVTKN